MIVCENCFYDLDVKALTETGVTECEICRTKYAQVDEQSVMIIDEHDACEYLGG